MRISELEDELNRVTQSMKAMTITSPQPAPPSIPPPDTVFISNFIIFLKIQEFAQTAIQLKEESQENASNFV